MERRYGDRGVPVCIHACGAWGGGSTPPGRPIFLIENSSNLPIFNKIPLKIYKKWNIYNRL